MAFNFSPDLYKKAYGSSPLVDIGFAYGSSSGDLSGGANKVGGGMAFDPVTLGLGVANIGAGLFTAGRASQTRRDIAAAQMAAAGDQLKWQTQLARESQKAGFAQDIANRVFGSTVAPDLELGRQREAAMFAAGPLGERQLALDVERGRREMGLKGSAEAKKLRQEQRRAELKQALAERQGQMAGMFGRIAPVDVSTLFV